MKEKIKKILNVKFLKNTKVKIGILIALLLIIAVGGGWIFLYNGKEKVDTEYISAVLQKSSELTTAKFNYTGMSEYEDTGIPIINKSDFIMVYKATARAGIDMEKVEIEVKDDMKIIYIKIPKAEVLDVKVDTETIKYFDTKFALLNVNEKEDSNKAIALAEKSAEKEIANVGVLEMADEQAETLIKGLLKDVVPEDYKMKIERK